MQKENLDVRRARGDYEERKPGCQREMFNLPRRTIPYRPPLKKNLEESNFCIALIWRIFHLTYVTLHRIISLICIETNVSPSPGTQKMVASINVDRTASN